ncbi:MAG: hypothetical protein LBG80_07285, partial [Bacteroidales bacterium]|nr:hypothetical protein [Bacteroidales bacterium]
MQERDKLNGVNSINYYDNYDNFLNTLEAAVKNKVSYPAIAVTGYGERYINSACPSCSAKGLL